MTERLKVTKRGVLATALAASLTLGAFLPLPALGAQEALAPATFPTAEAERVLSFGFDVIAERYLEPVTVEQLALDGLRGLGQLDPGLAIAMRDHNVELSTAERVVASFKAPAPDDSQDWADVAVRLTVAARSVSPALAKASAEDVYAAVFDAILADLDHFSRYASAAEARSNRARRNGFGGVGIRYSVENDRLDIREVLPETPASRIGLRIGDAITHIDGAPVGTLGDRDAISERMRGPMNSALRLTVIRAGESVASDMTIRRGLVVPQTVTLENTDDGVATIRITSFNQRTAKGVSEALDKAKRQLGRDMRGVLLDLRGNPGGLLDQAVSVSDMFINQGRIVFTRGRHPEAMQSYSARTGDTVNGLPVVVLLDGRSASAAEIVAAALQDSGRAVVIGSASYGKGTVQTVIRMPNDGEMTLTWSRFHSPSGYALHGLGVLPTVCVTDAAASADTLLANVASASTPLASQFALWRSTPLEDKQARQDLRTLCPPTNQADWASDTEVARRLLSDHAMFARALSATAVKSAAVEAGRY
ncbi:S41 family peptidase [Novispirillum sp. DQ9]|uniref:S41 family peptidase n=1 Tax=Novispirillum sp. DQ9 TaxID=3398612 RepID=UPI003C7EB019